MSTVALRCMHGERTPFYTICQDISLHLYHNLRRLPSKLGFIHCPVCKLALKVRMPRHGASAHIDHAHDGPASTPHHSRLSLARQSPPTLTIIILSRMHQIQIPIALRFSQRPRARLDMPKHRSLGGRR